MDNLHLINNNKFKGIYLSFNYTLDIPKEDISKFSVLTSILSKSSKEYENQTEIEKHLFKLYGSGFDSSVQKLGDLYNIEFSMEFINKKYLENSKDMLIPCLEFLNEIIYNPIFKDANLDNALFEREKESIMYKVKARKDDKMQYAISQTENLMSSDTLFGGYLYGDEEKLENLTTNDIVDAYNTLINKACVNIVISGNLDGYDDIENQIKSVFSNNINENINCKNLEINKGFSNNSYEEKQEKQDINQAIINFGLKIKDSTIDDFYKLMLYNTILGGTASSKLFQNFREKESLAYTVRSRYYRFKNIILIFAGIDKENYEKAKVVINREIDAMKNNITEEEFNSSKESLLSDINQWNDSKISIAKMVFSNLLCFKNNITVDEMYKKVSEVFLKDINEVANRVYVEKVYLLGGNSNE